MRFVIRGFCLLIVVLVSNGCCTVAMLMERALIACEYQKDVSSQPRFEKIMGRTFYLKEAVFLYTYPGECGAEHYVGPSKSSLLPASVEDYLRDPINWQYTDANARNGRGPLQHYGKAIVEGVITQGTAVTVTKSTVTTSYFRNDSEICHIYGFVQGVVDESGYLWLLNITDLFKNYFYSEKDMSINEMLLIEDEITGSCCTSPICPNLH